MKKQKREFVFRFLDFVKVKGKNIPVKVYELVNSKKNIDNKTLKLVQLFEKGINKYYKREHGKMLWLSFKKLKKWKKSLLREIPIHL